MNGKVVVQEAYSSLLALLRDIDDDIGWRPTLCAGWTVRDLVLHLLTDAQRALVALHTPAPGPADLDSVTYWQPWQPGTPGADAGRRGIRIMASAWTSVRPIAGLAEVRRVLDGRLGDTAPILDDTRYARLGTGRAALTVPERTALGAAADRLPLFG